MPITNAQAKQISSIVANVIVPFACFKVLTHHGVPEYTALAYMAIIPGLKIGYDVLRTRQIDIVGCFVLWEILLTITLANTFHNARLILLKGPIQADGLGVACLVSLVFKFPLARVLSQILSRPSVRVAGAETGHFRDAHPERLRIVTMAWGYVSILDAVCRTALIFMLHTDQYLLVSRIIQAIFFAVLGLWTIRYLRKDVSTP